MVFKPSDYLENNQNLNKFKTYELWFQILIFRNSKTVQNKWRMRSRAVYNFFLWI